MTPSQLIAMLNAMNCGDLDALAGRLVEARRVCDDLDQPALSGLLSEARQSLLGGDLKTYRRRLETVIARLGHIRARPKATVPGAGNPSGG